MNSYTIKNHNKIHPVGAYYLLNKNINIENTFCCCFSWYWSGKFKKMQFATSEKAYWQPSCKVSIQGTVIITGSLGHPQLP